MMQPSIQRHLLTWILGTLCLGGPLIVLAGYLITLAEIEEVLDDSLRQTALLLADRDLAPGPAAASERAPDAADDAESGLLTVARRPDGRLLFSSRPNLAIAFEALPGASVQQVNGSRWHVFTVVQSDRVIQVAQPEAVRNDAAVETALWCQATTPREHPLAVHGAPRCARRRSSRGLNGPARLP